VETPGGESWNV